MLNNYCEHCNVSVSKDLKYCPLCGKFVLADENADVQEHENSFPIYDLSYIYRAKWLKIVKQIAIFVSILCVGINLWFKTSVYWFPYALLAIFAVWKVAFKPFSEGHNHIKSIPISGLVIALTLVAIDVYNHIFFKTALGWAIVFASPAVLTGTVVLSLILALCTKKYDIQLVKGIIYLEIISVAVFILRLFAFKDFATWPTFMFFLANTASIFILFVSKRRRMVKEINRSFHI